jgi:hypothetical protein
MTYGPISFNFGSKYSQNTFFLTIEENISASYSKSQSGVEYLQHGQETIAKTTFFFCRFVRMAVPPRLL